MILASISAFFFFFFPPGFCFVCKFSVKLSREEIDEIGPCFASAGCDDRDEAGAAAAPVQQRAEEHQLPCSTGPKATGLSSFSFLHELVAPMCSYLSWDGKRPIFHSTGRERHKAVESPLRVCSAFCSWTGHSVKRARWFLSLHAFFTRGQPRAAASRTSGHFFGVEVAGFPYLCAHLLFTQS